MTSRTFLLAVLVVGFAAFAGVTAVDDVTNYRIVKQSASGGPEQAVCLSKPCLLKTLTCPKLCPKRDTLSPGKTACFIDCKSCTATCHHRQPNCYGYGAICYDPRFVGGDGVMFYFHGKKDNDFCLVSDRNLHVNAHFIGKRPEGRTRDYTWVQSLGIVFEGHQLSVGVKKVAIWNEEIDQLFVKYDGKDIDIPQLEGAIWTSPAGDVVIERTAVRNSAHVMINQLMEVSLRAVPITEQESKVHNYQITKENCFAHLQMQFNFFSLTPTVNGVLGQTYQPGFKNPVKRGVPMPIMGGDDKYVTSSLLAVDCKVSQFAAEVTSGASFDSLLSLPAQCESSGTGITCRR